MARATRRDVAQLAGVSLATVSHVMNGRAEELGFSPATADKVRKAADALGYIPRASARSFRYQSSKVVALVTGRLPDSLRLPVYNEVLLAAVETARDRGYFILPVMVPPEADDPAGMLREILSTVEIAGLVVEARDHLVPLGALFDAADIPVAWLATTRPPDNLGGVVTVGCDDTAGVAEMLRGIDTGGSATAVFVTGPGDHGNRADAFFDRFPAAETITAANWLADGGYAAANRRLSGSREQDMVFCANDFLAAGYLSACAEREIGVPGQVQIFGFGDHGAVIGAPLAISSVAWPLAQISSLAVTRVIDAVDKPAAPAGVITVTSSARPRSTTRPVG
ncbi:LacI family DNA-binding transcriptional regulator [Corynebacterium mendelii]|uniref:LacI family DNA-binding transcriptional regulator n=1 Tax=Corynebacterium mendelii TaxID=2765362 RepID=UPI002ED5097D